MRPLSDTTPKPMVRLQGRPLIDHVLDRLAAAGVGRAVVNLHYLADQIEAHLAARMAGGAAPEIRFSDERALLLDTGGGATKALPELGPGAFLIHNSDAVWRENGQSALAAMIAAWDPHKMDALLLLADVETALGYSGRGDFHIDPSGCLRRRGEDENAPHVFAGVSLCDARLFLEAPGGPFSLNLLWDRALQQGRLFGTKLDGDWMHIGTPQALAEAESLLAEARV